MSDTFLIKNTKYDDAGTNAELLSNSFLLGPGELNGPGGSARDSDLKLYGSGSVKWGEGIIQNIYRLQENNACPPKATGDHLPLAYGGSDTPNSSYIVTSHPILPKDEIDLGLGNGITNPIEGQSWCNTENGIMYNFVFGGSPQGLQWLSGGEGETILEGDLNLANNYEIYNVAAPTGSPVGSYVGNVSWNDTRYLNLTGGTMTGTLSLGSNRITNLLVAGSPTGTDAVNLEYISDNFISSVGGNQITTDLTFAHSGSPVYETAGIRWTGNTDVHRIFVEQYTATNSRLVLQSSNEANTDYISFQSINGGSTLEIFQMRYSRIEALVPFAGNSEFYGTDITGNYTTSAIELREVGLVSSSQSADAYAPALAFHWDGHDQAQLALESDGILRLRDGNTHSTLRTLDAGDLRVSGQSVYHPGNPQPATNGWILDSSGTPPSTFTYYMPSGYKRIKMVFTNVMLALNVNLQMRFSYDGGSTFNSDANYKWTMLEAGSAIATASANDTVIQFGSSVLAGQPMDMVLEIIGADASASSRDQSGSGAVKYTVKMDNSNALFDGFGFYAGATSGDVLDAIQFRNYTAGASFTGGTVSIYVME